MNLPLAHLEFGAGPPVVILHGLFGSARNWTTVAKRLGEGYRVFALDLRNHGHSPWADDMSFAAMADDVRAFVRTQGLGRAAVIGHSLGGKVAMTLALHHGEAVAGLVAADIAPVDYGAPGEDADRGSFLPYVEAMRALDLSDISRRADADARLAASVPEPAVRAFLLQNLELDGTPRWRINLDALAAATRDMAGFPDAESGRSYDGPALFLTGGRSGYVRADHHAAIRRLFPRAEIDVIPDAGHWLHAERPDAFVAHVRPFLDGLGLPG